MPGSESEDAPIAATASVTRKGQVTIPKEIRESLGLTIPGRIESRQTADGTIEVRPVKSPAELRGELATEETRGTTSVSDELRADRDRMGGNSAGAQARRNDADLRYEAVTGVRVRRTGR